MLISNLITNVQNTLQTNGTYRSETFVLKGINEALKLTSYLTLYDERRASVSITGTRNITKLPDGSDDANMIAPIYVSNTTSGNRVNPARILDLELEDVDWEGLISGADCDYYVVLSPVHELEVELLCTPIQNTGTAKLDIVGVFVPVDVSASDEITFSEKYGEVLYFYAMYYCYLSMPGRVKECLEVYREYVRLVNLMVQDLSSRFPSDQGVKPVPVEFDYDLLDRSDMKDQRQSREEQQVTQGA
jgi:hypothetical protein